MLIKQYLKNVVSWKTNRKIVVFGVDDFGNVRLASRQVRQKLDEAGFKAKNHFDRLDALCNADDLTSLYETLSSVKDKNGHPAVFTALALPANVDFKKIIDSNYTEYHYQLLPETLREVPGYEGVWALWQEGMKKELLHPQFHGREHLNLKLFKHNLKVKDPETLLCIKNYSYTGISNNPFKTIRPTGAFSIETLDDLEYQRTIIIDGLHAFEKVFGYKSTTFNAPGDRESSQLHGILKEHGVEIIETQLIKKEHLGHGKYKRIWNYTGKRNKHQQVFIVRNCLFEPAASKINWVKTCMQQIEAAFTLKNAAVISSHRVNFCSLLDENNRKNSLAQLSKLLLAITKKWPEVEFMNVAQLGALIKNEN